MRCVAKLFSASEILLDQDVKNKEGLFGVVGQLWEDHHIIKASQVIKSLEAREQLGSTGLGQGVAIPHARIEGLVKPTAIFVRSKEPIDFNSPDGASVNLFFILLVPARATEQHLQIVAEIAELLADPAFRRNLQTSKNPEQVHELFAAWK